MTFTATVSPSSGATGTVTFMDGGSTIGTSALNASGVATLSISSLAVGTHAITALYSGDGSHDGSTSSSLSQTVNKAGTTTTLDVQSQSVEERTGRDLHRHSFVLDRYGNGSVLRRFDSLGTVPLSSGNASLSTSALGGGKHSITAVYSGDANFAGSTSAVLIQTVTGKK